MQLGFIRIPFLRQRLEMTTVSYVFRAALSIGRVEQSCECILDIVVLTGTGRDARVTMVLSL